MEYNTTRSRMLMPEYGRNVQKMVEHLMTIEDRDKRLKSSEAIIELMGILNPHLKVMEDYRHKLWDHLYQMTDLKLDVDAPYPAPTAEELAQRPDPLPYPQTTSISYKHMGRNLESLLKKGLEEPDPERRQGFTQTIGYYMKLAYTNWHREPIHDDMIKNELAALTDGVMQYEPGGFRVHFDTRTTFKRNAQQGGQGSGNRNFKNAGGTGRNQGNSGGNQRGNYGSGSGTGTGNSSGSGYGNSGYNKNRKFNKNKSK